MSAKSSSSNTSMWLKFFRAAGINPGIDTKYALIFDENRIRMTMLMDIDKECLKDMGIVAMGDIIAILKHARKIHEETKEQAVETNKPSQSITPDPPTSVVATPPPPQATPRTTVTKSSVKNTNSVNLVEKAASSKSSIVKSGGTKKGLVRVITSKTLASSQGDDKGLLNRKLLAEHALAEKKIIVLNKRTAETVPLREEVPLQKKIRVLPEHEGRYKIKMPEGTTPRTQKIIQNRLGPALSEVKRDEKKTVFDRLGDSRVSSSTEVKQQQQTSTVQSDGPLALAGSDRSQKTMSSVFARLGDRGKDELAQPLAKISVDNSSKPLIQTRFEVRQNVTKEPQPLIPPPRRLTESRHNAYTEKTLTTIPSRISIPYMTNKYRLKSEISSPTASSFSSAASSLSPVRLISTKSSNGQSSQRMNRRDDLMMGEEKSLRIRFSSFPETSNYNSRRPPQTNQDEDDYF